MHIVSTRVLRGGWSLATLCALSLLVACNPAGNTPVSGPTPIPGLSPSAAGPTAPDSSPGPEATPATGSPTPAPPAGVPTASPNPAAGSSTSIRLPDGTRLVLTLPNRFLDGSGQSVRINAQLFDAAGHPIPIGDLRLRFSSSRPDLFSVDDQGLITALREDGFSTITVSVDGTDLSASQLVSVFTASGGGSGSSGGSQPKPTESLRLTAGFEGLGLGEFRVNTTTELSQRYSDVAMDDAGDFVIVWQSPDLNGSGIFGRRYDSHGTPQGEEFQINYNDSYSQEYPVVTMDADGDFVVAWSQNASGDYDVYARRFSKDGVPLAPEFRVNTYTTGNQSEPAISSNDDGWFSIAWTSAGQDGDGDGVFVRNYFNDGTPRNGDDQVNVFTTSAQRNPAIAYDENGEFTVLWQSYAQDGYGYGIYGRRYASVGTAPGTEFQVNINTTYSQVNPTLAVDAGGDFIAAWDSERSDGDNFGIVAAHFNSNGTPLSEEFQVNTITSGNQRNPQITIDGDGDFVIAWNSYSENAFGNGNRASVRRFRADDSPIAETQFNVFENPSPPGSIASLRFPALAGNSAGNFVGSWQSFNQDGSGHGIYARLYDAAGQAE